MVGPVGAPGRKVADIAGVTVQTVSQELSRLRKSWNEGSLPAAAEEIVRKAAGAFPYRLDVSLESVDLWNYEFLVETGRRHLSTGDFQNAATHLADAEQLWESSALAAARFTSRRELGDRPFARHIQLSTNELRRTARRELARLFSDRRIPIPGGVDSVFLWLQEAPDDLDLARIAMAAGIAELSTSDAWTRMEAALGPKSVADLEPLLRAVEAAQATRKVTPPPPAEAEIDTVARTRRKVCVLCFTVEFGSDVDLEYAARLLADLQGIVESKTTHYSIQLEREYDGITLLFGAKTTRDDDIIQAARIAYSLLGEIRSWATNKRVHGKAAIHTGEMLVERSAEGALAFTGTAILEARTLASGAPPWVVALSPLATSLLRHVFSVDETQEQAILASLQEPPSLAHHKMVGRDGDIGYVIAGINRALATNKPVAVSVRGEGGIGKTTFAKAIARMAPTESTVVLIDCRPRTTPISPVIKLSRDLRELVQRSALDEATWTVLDDLESPDSKLPPVEYSVALRKLVTEAATGRGLVVLLDDEHRADPATLDLLDGTLRRIDRAPLAVVSLARPDSEHAALVDRLPFEKAYLALDRLGLDDCRELLRELLNGDACSDNALEAITARSAGNPFFVEQLVTLCVDEGLLIERDGSWELLGDANDLPVPETISAILDSRVDQLSEDEREVLGAAAVMGQTFDAADLTSVISIGAIDEALISLTEQQLLIEQPSGDGRMVFSFAHALVGEAAGRTLEKRRRMELHAARAERLLQDQESTHRWLDVAYHWKSAWEYAVEVGETTTAEMFQRQAFSAFKQAAGQAVTARFRYTALRLYEEALACSPHPHDRRELLPEYAESLVQVGEHDRVAEVIAEIGPSATPTDAVEAYALLTAVRSIQFRGAARWIDDGLHAIEQALRVFEELGDDAGLARTYDLLVDVHTFRGELERGAEIAQTVIDYAERAQADDLQLTASTGLVSALFAGRSPVSVGLETVDTVAGRLRSRGLLDTYVTFLRACYASLRDGIDEYEEDILRTLGEMSERDQGLGGTATMAFALVQTAAGRHAETANTLRDSMRHLALVEDFSSYSTSAGMLAHVLARVGDVDGASRALAECQRHAGPEDVVSGALASMAGALLAYTTGDTETAVSKGREAVASISSTEFGLWPAEFRLDLATILRAAGEHESADRLLEEADALFVAKECTVHRPRLEALWAESPSRQA